MMLNQDEVESKKILSRKESFYCNIKRCDQDKMKSNQKRFFLEKNLSVVIILNDVRKKESFCCNIKRHDK